MKAKIKPCKIPEFEATMRSINTYYPNNAQTYGLFKQNVLSGVIDLTGEQNAKSYQTTFKFLDDHSKQMWINKEYVTILKELS